MIQEVLANAIRKQKEENGIQIVKENIKLSLFIEDMITYVENSKDSANILLELISKHSKFAGYKVNLQKSVAFLCTCNEQVELEIKNAIPSPKWIT